MSNDVEFHAGKVLEHIKDSHVKPIAVHEVSSK